MAGPSYSCRISSPQIVNLLEIDEPVSDFSGESTESEPDYVGNKSDSESDNGIGEENSDEASNPTQTHNVDWVWRADDGSYTPNKFPFSGICGTKKEHFVSN
jgi:hypothetical protein